MVSTFQDGAGPNAAVAVIYEEFDGLNEQLITKWLPIKFGRNAECDNRVLSPLKRRKCAFWVSKDFVAGHVSTVGEHIRFVF